ncbi:MAG: TonB-dependent receptor [Marinifilaceae bacterium]|jgi:outer membrane receptor protein involved in Fe transport|nr:TonB-dependent receptor [Marinifilaceae bacterium]
MCGKFNAIILFIFLLLVSSLLHSQVFKIEGYVIDKFSNQAIPGASVVVLGTNIGSMTDVNGYFELNNIKKTVVNIKAQCIGFNSQIKYEITLEKQKPILLNFLLEEMDYKLDEVKIKAQPIQRIAESPVSVQSITTTEIVRNPGGNNDISKVIQVLPGVGTVSNFRNDIFVRGGSPSENKFFIDGIEVPVINHFSTQGSSGGPVGLINVNFLRELNFYTGAFPVNMGNALSSVVSMRMKLANKRRINSSFTVGSSDIGITTEGPLGKKSDLIFSLRRSYLKPLFKLLKLPFLPVYTDYQFKYSLNIDKKNKLMILGLGAFDRFSLNKSVNDDISDQEEIDKNNFLINSIPINSQDNYCFGLKWTHFYEKGFTNFILSRNYLYNKAEKYEDDIKDIENLRLDYNSYEIENKLRVEQNTHFANIKIKYGFGIETAKFEVYNYDKRWLANQPLVQDYQSKLNILKYFAFLNYSQNIINNTFEYSLSVRLNASDYSRYMSNPLKQLSPRVAISYLPSEKLQLSANLGKYYMLPAYTILGYRDIDGVLVNKKNKLKYINCMHYVTGIKYLFNNFFSLNFECFYKNYSNYPFSISKSISMANLGADFGTIGNEPVNSNSKGRSYGIEFLAKQRLADKIYGIFSYTFLRSEFKGPSQNYVVSAWDSRHIINFSLGKKFKKNWEVGLKFRMSSGNPYTPYDKNLSSMIAYWDANKEPLLDYKKLNSRRLNTNHILDLRIDKKISLNKFFVNLYLDIQNVYNSKIDGIDYFFAKLDSKANPIIDPSDNSKYLMQEIENNDGSILPSIGLRVDF